MTVAVRRVGRILDRPWIPRSLKSNWTNMNGCQNVTVGHGMQIKEEILRVKNKADSEMTLGQEGSETAGG